MEKAIANIPQIWALLYTAPHTMIHNDCNPRNICLRKVRAPSVPPSQPPAPTQPSASGLLPYSNRQTLCMYDWELATIAVPQRDVAEFLAFTLQPSVSETTWRELVEFYRQHLQYYSNRDLQADR